METHSYERAKRLKNSTRVACKMISNLAYDTIILLNNGVNK